MNLRNPKNIPTTSDQSAGPNPQTCPNCRQTYMFEAECPTCKAKISEDTEKLLLAVRIKNVIDHMMADLYECNVEDLRKADSLVTKLIKQKEPHNG